MLPLLYFPSHHKSNTCYPLVCSMVGLATVAFLPTAGTSIVASLYGLVSLDVPAVDGRATVAHPAVGKNKWIAYWLVSRWLCKYRSGNVTYVSLDWVWKVTISVCWRQIEWIGKYRSTGVAMLHMFKWVCLVTTVVATLLMSMGCLCKYRNSKITHDCACCVTGRCRKLANGSYSNYHIPHVHVS